MVCDVAFSPSSTEGSWPVQGTGQLQQKPTGSPCRRQLAWGPKPTSCSACSGETSQLRWCHLLQSLTMELLCLGDGTVRLSTWDQKPWAWLLQSGRQAEQCWPGNWLQLGNASSSWASNQTDEWLPQHKSCTQQAPDRARYECGMTPFPWQTRPECMHASGGRGLGGAGDTGPVKDTPGSLDIALRRSFDHGARA